MEISPFAGNQAETDEFANGDPAPISTYYEK